jgi:hypothetical protein
MHFEIKRTYSNPRELRHRLLIASQPTVPINFPDGMADRGATRYHTSADNDWLTIRNHSARLRH